MNSQEQTQNGGETAPLLKDLTDMYGQKRVKILFKDGDSFKALRGIFLGAQGSGDNLTIHFRLDHGKLVSLKYKNVEKISDADDDKQRWE